MHLLRALSCVKAHAHVHTLHTWSPTELDPNTIDTFLLFLRRGGLMESVSSLWTPPTTLSMWGWHLWIQEQLQGKGLTSMRAVGGGYTGLASLGLRGLAIHPRERYRHLWVIVEMRLRSRSISIHPRIKRLPPPPDLKQESDQCFSEVLPT